MLWILNCYCYDIVNNSYMGQAIVIITITCYKPN